MSLPWIRIVSPILEASENRSCADQVQGSVSMNSQASELMMYCIGAYGARLQTDC